MDVNIVWCVRDMRSNVRTVCMLYIVYAITVARDLLDDCSGTCQ